MSKRWIDVGDGFKVGLPFHTRRALAAGHITGREAGEEHRISAAVWRFKNLTAKEDTDA